MNKAIEILESIDCKTTMNYDDSSDQEVYYRYEDVLEAINKALTLQRVSQQSEPCTGNCGMNYCDDNGCIERKRILVEPTDLPVHGGQIRNANDFIADVSNSSFDDEKFIEALFAEYNKSYRETKQGQCYPNWLDNEQLKWVLTVAKNCF